MPNPAEDLVAFIRTNTVGCAFAMHIAKDPDREGLEPLIINSWADPGELGVLVGSLLEGQPKIAAAIFPNITTTEQLVELIEQLGALDSWRVEPRDVEDQEHIGVGMRWVMPDGIHESWVLGFAPMEHMPSTRRAPHVAVLLKADPTEQPFLKRDASKVSGLRGIHLADLPFAGSVDDYAATWRNTRKLRLRSLEGHLEEGGKAKVTFTLPVEYRERIEALS